MVSLAISAASLSSPSLAQPSDAPDPPPWSSIRSIQMRGDLKAFWNVLGGDNATNDAEAVAHGFGLVRLVGTYSDYPGKQKENVYPFLKRNKTNPWSRPDFFERIIKRNIRDAGSPRDLFVHDIEFEFEQDPERAWSEAETRQASGVQRKEDFAEAYWKAWATWFAEPCRWAKETYPQARVGVYGAQPFRRDYWGLNGKTKAQIDAQHRADAALWKSIDPFVDYYVASVYVFYDRPDSIYYMAANIEENYRRTRSYGDKPVYAYLMLRYQPLEKRLGERELDDYLVEASAVLPYFTGARGFVLHGWEPKRKGQCYTTLPLFMNSLDRVARISEKLAKAQLQPDAPVYELWKRKAPLVRRMKVSENEWYVLATNPWQEETAASQITVSCGSRQISLTLNGKHTELFHIQGNQATRIAMPDAGS